jgi:hypothetical protein
MPSNTVKSVVARFLRNKHRDDFMALNPWMDLPTAAIVYFRRHTSHKFSYASYRDIPNQTDDQYKEYFAAYSQQLFNKWWQIPVSQKQCAGIKPDTLARYTEILAKQIPMPDWLADELQDVQ